MLDFKALFAKAERVREIETGREFDAVQMLAPFESPCPDKFELRPSIRRVEKSVFEPDPVTGDLVELRKLVDEPFMEKVIDQDKGHHRGGNIRGVKGDYILFDGEGFFVVKEKDGTVPIFKARFVKL